MSIYDGCIDNSKIIFSWNTEEFNDKLSNHINSIKDNYNYAIVDISHCVSLGARIVLYSKDKDIPERMKNYKNKWMLIDNEWIRETDNGI